MIKKPFLSILIVCTLSSGCAFKNQAGAHINLFQMTVTAPVLATLKGDIFSGLATGYSDGTGVIEVQSEVETNKHCVGEFRYVRRGVSGIGTMTCNDGAKADFNFTALDSFSGYGYGSSTRGAVTFTFGLTPDQSSKYLLKPFPEVEKVTKKLLKKGPPARVGVPK